MKIVIFFAPNFCDWAVEIIRRMAEKNDALEVIGLAIDQEIYEKISSYKDLPIKELYNIDDIEKSSISQTVSDEAFKALEDQIGSDVLRKTVIADKNLAGGWIDGAIIFDTPLAAKTKDPEHLKAYVHGLYSFLIDLYRKHDPDLAFIYTIASGATYAIAAAARHHGFPFLRFQHSRIQQFFILDTTLEGMLEPVQAALHIAKEDPAYLSPLYPQAKEYLESYRKKSADTSNLALNKKMASKAMQWPSVLRAFAGICVRSIQNTISPQDFPLRQRPERLNFVFKVSSALIRRYRPKSRYERSFKPYKNQEYVYFALHVDPEASTLISAPFHANQTAVIEALSKSIPLSSVLLVKEHPIMIGKRPFGFYKKIAGMPNVRLIDHEEPSYELIQNAALVATITGTAGWEALVMHKPLLLLGETPYMAIGEGLVFCQDYAQLQHAIPKALQTKPAEDTALITYIAAVMKTGIQVPDALLWNRHTGIFEKHRDVTENLADYFLHYMERKK